MPAAGYKLIFGTSFGFMDAMVNTAKDNPTVKFMHASGYKRSDNLGTYFGRMEQPDYLSGLVAGKMTKTNKIGFVLPFSIPECIREVDSFTVGLREVNPKATVTVVYTNSWFDPAKEGDSAKSLLNQGCDIIVSGVDSPAPLDEAFKAGKYGIGYDMDMAAGMKTTGGSQVRSHVPHLALGSLLSQGCQGCRRRNVDERRLLGRHG